MITLLSKLLIKNYTDYTNSSVRHAYGMLCSGVGIFLNLLMSVFKLIAGIISGSISITADAVNNMSDAGSSLITMIGFKLSAKKPDPDHPFGHGRIEYVSALIVSLAIILMGIQLMRDAFGKVIAPEPVNFSWLSIVILCLSILVKFYMAFYNIKIGEKINSSAMKATVTDSLSDCLSTLVVLVATLVAHFTGWLIDGWAGLLVALFILYAGICAVRDTLKPLLGQPPEPEFVDQIARIVLSNDAVVRIHDLVVHDYGPGRRIISLHAEVPAKNDILEMHDAIDLAEKELIEQLGCLATIHMDPIDTEDELTQILCEKISQAITEIDPDLTMHDFRIVSGPTHTNLIFDVVVKHNFRLSDIELKKVIAQKVSEICDTLKDGKEYFTVIQIDKSYL